MRTADTRSPPRTHQRRGSARTCLAAEAAAAGSRQHLSFSCLPAEINLFVCLPVSVCACLLLLSCWQPGAGRGGDSGETGVRCGPPTVSLVAALVFTPPDAVDHLVARSRWCPHADVRPRAGCVIYESSTCTSSGVCCDTEPPPAAAHSRVVVTLSFFSAGFFFFSLFPPPVTRRVTDPPSLTYACSGRASVP
jgi:hypothetical protein